MNEVVLLKNSIDSMYRILDQMVANLDPDHRTKTLLARLDSYSPTSSVMREAANHIRRSAAIEKQDKEEIKRLKDVVRNLQSLIARDNSNPPSINKFNPNGQLPRFDAYTIKVDSSYPGNVICTNAVNVRV